MKIVRPVASLAKKLKAQEFVLGKILAMRLPGLIIWVVFVDSGSTFHMVTVVFQKSIGGEETTEDWETYVWRHCGQSDAPL